VLQRQPSLRIVFILERKEHTLDTFLLFIVGRLLDRIRAPVRRPSHEDSRLHYATCSYIPEGTYVFDRRRNGKSFKFNPNLPAHLLELGTSQ
jgi:hypothetical protein